jgi:hypothetical protein
MSLVNAAISGPVGKASVFITGSNDQQPELELLGWGVWKKIYMLTIIVYSARWPPL